MTSTSAGASASAIASRGAQVDVLEMVRVPAGLGDRLRLLGGAAREHDLVLAVEQEARERRPPRTRTDDEEPHREKLSRNASLATIMPPTMGGFFFVAWVVSLPGAAIASLMAPSDDARLARAGRILFALLLLAELLLLAFVFAVETRDGSGSIAGSRSFWWLMTLGYGVPFALAAGLAVRRGYVGHRLALISADPRDVRVVFRLSRSGSLRGAARSRGSATSSTHIARSTS